MRDAATGVRHAPEVARFAVALADAVGELLDSGRVPLVMGSTAASCSVTRWRYTAAVVSGWLFLDGHADFYQPAAEPTGDAASMDLALVTGHGPALLAGVAGRGGLTRAEDAVAFGFRDGEDSARDGSQPLPGDLLALDLAAVRDLSASGPPAMPSTTSCAPTVRGASGFTSTRTSSMTP